MMNCAGRTPEPDGGLSAPNGVAGPTTTSSTGARLQRRRPVRYPNPTTRLRAIPMVPSRRAIAERGPTGRNAREERVLGDVRLPESSRLSNSLLDAAQ
jgi:hypothetical protein